MCSIAMDVIWQWHFILELSFSKLGVVLYHVGALWDSLIQRGVARENWSHGRP